MTKVSVKYKDYRKDILKESIFGMCGKGHEKGTEVHYKLVGDYYEYVDVTTGIIVRTAKLCV